MDTSEYTGTERKAAKKVSRHPMFQALKKELENTRGQLRSQKSSHKKKVDELEKELKSVKKTLDERNAEFNEWVKREAQSEKADAPSADEEETSEETSEEPIEEAS